MFDIRFSDEVPDGFEVGSEELYGEIVLGDHIDGFLAPIDIWSRREYELQWIRAAQRLATGHQRSAFITAAFSRWWPAWQTEESVILQEHLILPRSEFTDLDVFGSVPSYRGPLAEYGRDISEWRMHRADFVAYLVRHGFGAGSA